MIAFWLTDESDFMVILHIFCTHLFIHSTFYVFTYLTFFNLPRPTAATTTATATATTTTATA